MTRSLIHSTKYAVLVTLLCSTPFDSTVAEQPEVTKVEFIVGDYLTKEGGTTAIKDSPLLRPFGTDFDAQGTLYIVELEGGRVHRLNKGSQPEVISGNGSKSYSGDGGPVSKATYNGMHNIAITKDNRIFVSDTFNHCIREIDLDEDKVTTVSGNGKTGFAGDGEAAKDAQYNYLMSISLTPAEDAILIADLKNARIRKLDLESMKVSTVAGNGKNGIPKDGAVATESPLVDPRAVAQDSLGNIYILERNGHALRRVNPDGTITTVAGTGKKGFRDGTALAAQFGSPKHICVDTHNRVYIADDANGAIRCYDPETETVSTLLGRGFGDKKVRLNQPHGVTIEKGNLFVCDTSNNRVFKLILKN